MWKNQRLTTPRNHCQLEAHGVVGRNSVPEAQWEPELWRKFSPADAAHRGTQKS